MPIRNMLLVLMYGAFLLFIRMWVLGIYKFSDTMMNKQNCSPQFFLFFARTPNTNSIIKSAGFEERRSSNRRVTKRSTVGRHFLIYLRLITNRLRSSCTYQVTLVYLPLLYFLRFMIRLAILKFIILYYDSMIGLVMLLLI